jgi:hypothetical protein
MAQLIDLGKIRFSFEGDWTASATYEYNDVVRYGGDLFVYTFNSSTASVLPSNTTYWNKMIGGFDFEGSWSASSAYRPGQVVSYGGKVYIAIDTNSNSNPSTASAAWTKLVDGIQYEGDYNNSTDYQPGDVVKYGGISYIATVTTNGNEPTSASYWDQFVPGVDYKGVFDSSTLYQKNDIVTFGGTSYIATQSASVGNPVVDTSSWDTFVDGIQFEGVYSSASAYQANDVVSYGALLYIAKSNVSASVLPTSTSFWEVFTEGFKFNNAYDNGTEYVKNDIVSYGGILYIASQTTTGNAPTNTTYWDVLTQGFRWLGTYDNGTTYLKNDLVSYGGSTYISITETVGNDPVSASNIWSIVANGTFPDQTGNAGKFLTTDGTQVSWASDLAADIFTANDKLYVGASAVNFESTAGLTNAVAVFQWDEGVQESSFAQLSFQNTDPTSSTDIITYMDNGDDSVGWMGMGITGSQFDDEIYGITGPGDGYIFHNTVSSGYTGNIVIATGAEGSENKIVFAAGGFDSGLTQMEITPGVNVHVEIPTPSTSPETGAFTVVGGVGIQGDMNIQGDVNVVGTITFGGEGTTVATSNLAVDDPLIFSGNSNTNDIVDLGVVGGYGKSVSTLSASVTVATLSSNIATLTTDVAHGFSVNDIVTVSGISASYDGNYIITGVPVANQFSYAKTLGNISTASVSGLSERTRSRRYAGVVRDATDSVIKFFQDATTKPTSTVNFSEIGLTLGDIQASGATLQSLIASDIISTGSAQFTGGLSSTGANTEITGSATITGLLTLKTTINGSPTFAGDPVFTGTPAFTGGVRIQELLEDVVDVSQSANAVTLDYSLGNVFWVSNSFTGNFTVNVTNAGTTDGRVFTVNLFVTQTATGYIPSTLNVNGSGVTIKWASGVTPTGTSSSGKIDVFSFTIIRRGSSWTALGAANTNF